MFLDEYRAAAKAGNTQVQQYLQKHGHVLEQLATVDDEDDVLPRQGIDQIATELSMYYLLDPLLQRRWLVCLRQRIRTALCSGCLTQ